MIVEVIGGADEVPEVQVADVDDLTIASREHARFKQTDADVGSFDAGYGSAYLAKMVGQQIFAGEATRLGYGTDEAAEGRDAFLEKRDPDWSRFPYHF